jgi:hypothetical protein
MTRIDMHVRECVGYTWKKQHEGMTVPMEIIECESGTWNVNEDEGMLCSAGGAGGYNG